MAGGVFSSALLNGMTIRESATDGSDFTNPAADYRRLFLGEDGFLHVKDSAGNVTDPYDAAGSGIADTILDAKGDLISATAADTPAKLTVGANLTTLIAASGESTGLLWNRPAGDRVLLSAGNYTGTTGSFGDVTGATLTITTLARRCLVGVVGAAQVGGAADSVVFDIDIDGSRQGGTNGLTGLRVNNTGHRYNFSFTYMTDVLSAASHTFKLQSKRAAGSGTVTILMDSADSVVEMWVQEQL